MSKKVLITGASGLLGRSIFKEFENEGSWDVLGLAFSRVTGKLQQLDLTNSEQVRKVVNVFKPSVIIHSAAERRPDVVEKKADETKKLNVDATRNVCEAAALVGAWVLYISTDYVFDGKTPPFSESAEPNPLNKYGLSKLAGEKVVFDVSTDNSILRVPILYGDIEYLGESAVTVLFEKVKVTESTCVMSDYERRFPTYCADVAYVIRQLSEKRIQDSSIKGVYHWSGDECMTKYDMAVAMAEVFGLSTNHIQADRTPSGGATRPYNAHLGCDRLDTLGFGRRSAFKNNIFNILKPFS